MNLKEYATSMAEDESIPQEKPLRLMTDLELSRCIIYGLATSLDSIAKAIALNQRVLGKYLKEDDRRRQLRKEGT